MISPSCMRKKAHTQFLKYRLAFFYLTSPKNIPTTDCTSRSYIFSEDISLNTFLYINRKTLMNQTNLRKHSHINHPYYGLWSLQFWGEVHK